MHVLLTSCMVEHEVKHIVMSKWAAEVRPSIHEDGRFDLRVSNGKRLCETIIDRDDLSLTIDEFKRRFLHPMVDNLTAEAA